MSNASDREMLENLCDTLEGDPFLEKVLNAMDNIRLKRGQAMMTPIERREQRASLRLRMSVKRTPEPSSPTSN